MTKKLLNAIEKFDWSDNKPEKYRYYEGDIR